MSLKRLTDNPIVLIYELKIGLHLHLTIREYMKLTTKALLAIQDRKMILERNKTRSPYYKIMYEVKYAELLTKERTIKEYAQSRYTR